MPSCRTPRGSRRLVAVVVPLALAVAGCQLFAPDDDGPDESADAAATTVSVAVASFDQAVGDERRLLAGVFSADASLVAFGDVVFEIGFLGDEPTGTADAVEQIRASFLPVPGREPSGASEQPVFLSDQPGAGVYEARVDLDRAGWWGLRVTAEFADGTVRRGTTSFLVQQQPSVPAVGDEAPRSRNLTIADVEAGRAAPVALDSRAQDPDGDIPDPHLHGVTIAEALDAARPVVAVFSTPVYCQSQFCGPLVDVISELAPRYDDRAEFVMVEVWENFEEQRLNEAAAEWIQTETGGNEPWVFLIDGDGTILARWDNVLDVAELEAALEALPATPRLD